MGLLQLGKPPCHFIQLNKFSRAVCFEKRGGIISDKFCWLNSHKPEPRFRSCNLRPCKTRWKVWKWSECSGCLFVPGIRTRMIECVREKQDITKASEIIVNQTLCCGTKPPTVEICFSIKPCIYKRDKVLLPFEPLVESVCPTIFGNTTTHRSLLSVFKKSVTPKVILRNSSDHLLVSGMNNTSKNDNTNHLSVDKHHVHHSHNHLMDTSSGNLTFRPKRFNDLLSQSNVWRKKYKLAVDINKMEDIHLYVASIENQTCLGLSEVDFEQIGDLMSKYVISNTVELIGEEAFQTIKLIRANDNNVCFSILDYLASLKNKNCKEKQ